MNDHNVTLIHPTPPSDGFRDSGRSFIAVFEKVGTREFRRVEKIAVLYLVKTLLKFSLNNDTTQPSQPLM